MIKRIYNIILFCLMISASQAQSFNYQTKVLKVNEKGFHNILLSPAINSKMNPNFSDVRIYDNENIEIPYLLRTETSVTYSQLFKEYKIISNEIIKGSITRLIIKNQEKSKVNNISLMIKNSDVDKKMKLFGSDDQKNWYIIKDNYLFFSIYSNTESSELKLMNFPLSDYSYFKIEVDDSKSAPIKILKVGYYDDYSELGKYTEVPGMKISQIDSSEVKRSYIKITFDTPQYIDKLELNFGGPSYFLRNVNITNLIIDSSGRDHRDDESYFETMQKIEISSNYSNVIYFSKFKTKDFYLLVENGDNQPLKINGGKAYQLNNYLTADLEVGKEYNLKFGSPELSFPDYDLKYFQENIPSSIPIISTGEISELNSDQQVIQPSPVGNKIILWIVIGVIVLFFGILAVKMVREMK